MPHDGNEAEWLTRKKRIDAKLISLNPPWKIIPWRSGRDTSKLACHAVTEFPTESGPADYALFVDGIFLGILEAKKVAVNPQNVLEQAKRYSRGAANGSRNWNLNVARPFHPLSASTGERARVRCRSGIRSSCRIREFRNRPNPKVAVTVEVPSLAGAGDALRPSDGRRWQSRMRENTWPGEGRGAKDIPALEFIVFLRPVKSRILTLLVRCSQLSSLNYQPACDTLIQYFKNTTDFEIQPPTKTPLTLPLSFLTEQTRILGEVERRLSVVEELESVVSANLQRATRLRQSILQKAFTGKL